MVILNSEAAGIESRLSPPPLTSRAWEQKYQAEIENVILGKDTTEGLDPDSRVERQTSERMLQRRGAAAGSVSEECGPLDSPGLQGGPAAVR